MEVKKVWTENYIALENYDFLWSEDDLREFRDMWKKDEPINVICKRLERKEIEIAIIILDQAQKGIIKKRKIGLGIEGFVN